MISDSAHLPQTPSPINAGTVFVYGLTPAEVYRAHRKAVDALRLLWYNLTIERKAYSVQENWGAAMKKTDRLVNLLISDIENKTVLEVACGTADFSLSAARFAKSVTCIDLDDSRLNSQIEQANIRFQIMDAAKMDFPDSSFDTVVLYNSFFHIQPVWSEIERECRRVVRGDGTIYIVGSWKLDTNLMKDIFGDAAGRRGDFLTVRLTK